MKIKGKDYRTIWLAPDGWSVEIIDQTRLPHELVTMSLKSAEDAARAILTMQVRGAPLIGATAAYGLAMAIRQDASDEAVDRAVAFLEKQRPDRDQPALGAAGDAPRRAKSPARSARRRRLQARGRDLRRGRRDLPHDRRARPQDHRGHRRREEARRDGRGAHPLQRRLARLRRLGHGDLADLPGARCRRSAPRLGRRDAAAQPGRGAHRLRARQPRRAAYHRRRQRRRPPDAAASASIW